MIQLDLRRDARRAPVHVPGLDALAPETVGAAVDNWRARMVSEHVSARVFAALVRQLMRAGAPRREVVAV